MNYAGILLIIVGLIIEYISWTNGEMLVLALGGLLGLSAIVVGFTLSGVRIS